MTYLHFHPTIIKTLLKPSFIHTSNTSGLARKDQSCLFTFSQTSLSNISHLSQKTTKMAPPILFSISLFLFSLLHCSTTTAQSPAAAPAPPGPANVIKILEKSGQFTVFIRLLKATREDVSLNGQLNNSNNGVTIFAPSDSAFSSLKSGALNALSDEEKSELVQFHIIPNFLSTSQFQTVSNPLTTQAGTGERLELNVTTSGNSVNITTGLTNTSVSSTIYTDNQLAVYQVDKVLQPIDIFTPKPPPPAPAPKNSKEKTKAADSPTVTKDASCVLSSIVPYNLVLFGAGIVAAAIFSF